MEVNTNDVQNLEKKQALCTYTMDKPYVELLILKHIKYMYLTNY